MRDLGMQLYQKKLYEMYFSLNFEAFLKLQN